MSTITQNMNPERTNRWLLIGAAVLALVTGVLLFVALASFGGSDDNSSSLAQVAAGDTDVLVARQQIEANTKITDEMIGTETVSSLDLVDGAVTDQALVVGKVARATILEGEQLTTVRVGTVEGEAEPGFRDTIPAGRRATSVEVSEQSSVAGLLIPGDRVDVIAIYTDENNDQDLTRVETILQNIEVLAFAQESLEAVPSLDAEGAPIETESAEGSLGERPEDLEPNENAGTATLSLTPEEVLVVVAAQHKGELTLSLRAPADADTPGLPDRTLTGLGFVVPRNP